MTVELYPDQIDLVNRVRAAMGQGYQSVLMQASTGSGKTRMALDMVTGAVRKGSTAMFCVPRTELLLQTMETLAGYDVPFSTIAPYYSYSPITPVHLAMSPTLARRLAKVKPPKVLFIDECHYGGAELEKIIGWAMAAGSRIVGLSATPMKKNGKGMGAWYQHMEQGLPVADLIRLGRLSQFRYFGPSAPDLSGLAVRDGEYVQSQVDALMEQDTAIIGDAVATYRQRAMGKLCVVFATSRKHAGIIKQMYQDRGIPAQMIDGTMDAATRKRLVMGFARREYTVLINVMLLTFGFDLAQAAGMPVRIEALTDLCPRKSLALQMQVWGRALRAGDEPAIIMDHANNWRENGFPDSPRDWSLEGAKKRGSRDQEATEPTRQCAIGDGGCGFVHRPAPSCPNCGHVYPVQSRIVDEREGELLEIDREAAEAARKAARMEQGRAGTLEALEALGRRTGRSPGWARNVWNGRMKAKKRGAA